MADLVSMRVAYGAALVELGGANESVVALSADVCNSDFSYQFEARFPNRFFNVGIAEPCLVDVAVGLAYSGLVPFANTFAFLFATRALEMIRTHCCYGRANVKLMGAYAGLSDSYDGPTHHSISDIAIMRSLPGMTIVVPSDATAVAKLLPQMAAWKGAVYCRLNRNEVPTIFGDDYSPVIGKAVPVHGGCDLSFIAAGIMVERSLRAAELLAKAGISARVVEVHTIKPLDEEAVLGCAAETGAIVTAEEHSVIGGLGGAVAELLGERSPTPVVKVGVKDRFAECGSYDQLLEAYGLKVADLVEAAKRALAMKKK